MKKITIITDNRIGILAEVTEMMALGNINIDDIRVDAVEDFGCIHLRVDHYDEALKVLQGSSFSAYTEDVILIKIEDRPGGLAKIAKKFKDQGIDVKSIRIARRSKDIVIVAVSCDKMDLARDVVKDLLL